MNYAAMFWHKLYKSNFYSRSNETQRQFQEAMAEFLKEYEEEKSKR
jgi:hypothetical protein